ncbi:MAG: hypothetical protein RR458_06270, partial [Clostridia bacterium]
LNGNDIAKCLSVLSAYQIATNTLFGILKNRYGGKYHSLSRIILGSENKFSMQTTIWFNLITMSILGVYIIQNMIKSVIKNRKTKSREKL